MKDKKHGVIPKGRIDADPAKVSPEAIPLATQLHRHGGASAIAVVVFGLEALLLLAPLFFSSLARPFALWDYMTGFPLYMPHDVRQFWSLFQNYWHNLVALHTGVLRPTYSLVLNVQFLLFGGEFWIFYIVKWAAKLASIYFVDRMLRQVGGTKWSRLAIASLLLFHPASFELMMTSADGWVAFFGLLAICVTAGFNRNRKAPMDIASMSGHQFAIVFVLWFLALGTKEVGLALAIAWLVIAHLDSAFSRRFFVRSSFCYASLAWFLFRLRDAAQSRRANFSGGTTPRIRLRVLAEQLSNLTPPSVHGWMTWLMAALLILTIWAVVRTRNRTARSLFAVHAVWAVLTLGLISTTDAAMPRYVVPVIFALALPIGIGMSAIPRQFGSVWVAFALVFPAVTAGDLYRQALAYQQLFYETSDVITAAQNQAEAGYQICLTGQDSDIPLENQGSLRLFFEQFGPQWYGQERRSVVTDIHNSGVPRRGCALIARYNLAALLSAGIPGLTPPMIRTAYEFERTGYGVLETQAARLSRVSASLGRAEFTTYDIGAPVVSSTPSYRLYVIDPRCDPSGDSQKLVAQFSNPSRNILRKDGLEPGKTYSYTAGSREAVKWQIRLDSLAGRAQVFFGGAYNLLRGAAIYGISDESGNDLWAVSLVHDRQWHSLPTTPALTFLDGHQYFLFAFAQDSEGLDLAFRDVRMREEPGFSSVQECQTRRNPAEIPAMQFSNQIRGPESTESMLQGKVYSYRTRAGEPVKWSLRIPPQEGRSLLFYTGQYRLTRGTAIFGISDPVGNDLWAAELRDDNQWHDMPAAPPLDYRKSQSYVLFVFTNALKDTEFAVRDVQIGSAIRVKVQRGTRRFGAMAW